MLKYRPLFCNYRTFATYSPQNWNDKLVEQKELDYSSTNIQIQFTKTQTIKWLNDIEIIHKKFIHDNDVVMVEEYSKDQDDEANNIDNKQ